MAQRRFFRRADLFVDPINHSRFLDHPALLGRQSVRPIFLARRPADAIASMVDLLGRHDRFTQKDAVRYYLERLRDLERMALSR